MTASFLRIAHVLVALSTPQNSKNSHTFPRWERKSALGKAISLARKRSEGNALRQRWRHLWGCCSRVRASWRRLPCSLDNNTCSSIDHRLCVPIPACSADILVAVLTSDVRLLLQPCSSHPLRGPPACAQPIHRREYRYSCPLYLRGHSTPIPRLHDRTINGSVVAATSCVTLPLEGLSCGVPQGLPKPFV
jgi:hypothetical protein